MHIHFILCTVCVQQVKEQKYWIVFCSKKKNSTTDKEQENKLLIILNSQ